MTKHIYEITLPAFLGMQSFVPQVDDVRKAMTVNVADGYVELPLAQRVYVVSGNRIQHAVYVFRLVATEEEFQAVYEVLDFKFPDKAPRSIECRPYWTPGVG